MSEVVDLKLKGVDEKFCGECGEIIKTKAELCPKCGVRQFSPNRKNKVVAALFAVFLGAFGGHKFYLGKIGQGLLYLFFFWTLIPAIIAFIEFILLLAMSDEAFDQKYGSS